jgi:nitroreductase
MGIIDDLNWRYATKVFSDKKIPQKDLDELLEALRLAPSSFGVQPWKFIVVTDPKIREQLAEHSYGQRQVTDASYLIVLAAVDVDESYIRKYVESMAKTRNVPIETLKDYEDMMLNSIMGRSSEERLNWAKRQIYIALGILHAACAAKRIDSCPMEGFDSKKYDEILGLKGCTSVVLCPVGYRGDDKYASQKKVRFPKEDVFEFM